MLRHKDHVELHFHPLTCFRRYGAVLEISQLYSVDSLNIIRFPQLGLITTTWKANNSVLSQLYEYIRMLMMV
jgi:hypothetical protein